jgi:hypothetical protein
MAGFPHHQLEGYLRKRSSELSSGGSELIAN